MAHAWLSSTGSQHLSNREGLACQGRSGDAIRRLPPDLVQHPLRAQLRGSVEGMRPGPGHNAVSAADTMTLAPCWVNLPSSRRGLAVLPDRIAGPAGPGVGVDPAAVEVLWVVDLFTPEASGSLTVCLGARSGAGPDVGLDRWGWPGGQELRLWDGGLLAIAAAAASYEPHHGQDSHRGDSSTKHRRHPDPPPS